MKVQNFQKKKNKSLNKNQINKTKSISKNNEIKKAKSKNKTIISKGNSTRFKTTSNKNKKFNLNKKESEAKNNYDNKNYNSINVDEKNNYEYFPNEDIYNNNINNISLKSLNGNSLLKNSLFMKSNYTNMNIDNNYNNTKTSFNNLMMSNQSESLEKNIINKKYIDRLLFTSKNILEKQNNILSDCDILTKNVAMNDYSIKNIIKEGQNDYQNIFNIYNKNISEVLSKMKENKKDIQSNTNLKIENENLKQKLDMLNINNEDNINMKENEINNLKTVLVGEINHLINFLEEIGYDNLSINKMDIVELTSQKITNFFQMIIKIIKEMKEKIHKKENIISKMSIEQNMDINTYRTNNNNINISLSNLDLNNINNINNINKSNESPDYNNICYKTYNFSVRNSFPKKNYNISFRNYQNNKNESLIEKTQKSLNLNSNDFMANKYFYNNDESERIDKLKYNKYDIGIKKEENNKTSNEVNNINSINKKNEEENENCQTGKFNFQNISNNIINKEKI